MPSFEYKALNAKGQEIAGKINASNQEQAIKQLQTEALYPVDIKKIAEISSSQSTSSKRLKLSFFKKTVPLGVLADFSRQFGMLVESGIPYNRGLQILSRSTTHSLMLEVISEMHLNVLEGLSLHKAMEKYPDVFPRYYRTAIMAGERTGRLGSNLLQQSDFLASQIDLRNKVQAALIYPAIMSVLGVGIVIFMIEFILPKITPIFEFFEHALPLPTRIMINISNFLSQNTYLLLFTLLGILLVVNYYLKTPKGQYFFDRLILKIPAVGGLMHKVYLSRFALSLSALLQSGITVKEALRISGDSTGNSVFVKNIENVEQLTVDKGYSLSQALKKSEVFDEKFVQIVNVGEESGTLDTMMTKVADSLKAETQASIQKFVSFLEPVIILSMALMVGSIVLAILLPIFEMNQLIR